MVLIPPMQKNDVIDEPDILTALPTPHRLKDEKQNSEYTKLINYDLNNLIAIISLKDILTPNSLKLEDLETKGKRYWFFKLSVSISQNITLSKLVYLTKMSYLFQILIQVKTIDWRLEEKLISPMPKT